MGLADNTEPEDFVHNNAADETSQRFCLNHQKSNIRSKALASKLRRFKEKKINRGIFSKGFEANKTGHYTIFDSPGSDRFHFGNAYDEHDSSAHGSVVSLEWDSQDCYKDLVDSSPAPRLTMNPLYLSQPSIVGHTTLDNSLVRLDSSACTALYTSTQNQSASVQTRSTAVSCDSLLWDTDHEREGKTRSVKESCDSLQWDSICQTKHQDLQDVDLSLYDKETENLLNEIEHFTSQALRETNRWNIQVNQMTEKNHEMLTNREEDDSVNNVNCDRNINSTKHNINQDPDTLNHCLANHKKSHFGEISSICTDTPSPMSISADSANLGSM